MKKTASLKQLASLVETNLRSRRSIILGEEKRKKKILNILVLCIFFIASIEFSLIRMFNMLRLSNNEILIFNSIINIQIILTILFMFIKIMNTFYLASDWKEMMVYPIKSGNLLLSKCTLCYLSSVLISIFVLILLFSYGILTNAGITYYLYAVIYEIIISAVPTVFLALISLTIFWIMAAIKESKSGHKNNKWLILIDLAVIILTYMLLKSALSNHVKIGSLLFNVFFNGNQSTEILINFIIVLSIIIFSCLGFYFIGGNVYLTIMKSTIFSSRYSKKIELQPSQYEFKLRNPIISNIIRDAKLIMRIPVLRFSCITVNIICSTIAVIILIIFRKQVISIGIAFWGIDNWLVIVWFLSFLVVNATSVTSFSREGRALNQFKAFPLDSKKLLLSKVYIGILTNIFSFINTNVLIVLIASNFSEFILFEIVIIIYMIAIVIIQIEVDIDSIELKWIAINDLLENGHYLKLLKPYFILMMLPVIFILVSNGIAGRLLHIEFTEYLNASLTILVGVIYCIHSFKKIIDSI